MDVRDIRLSAACLKTYVSRYTGSATDVIMSARTMPGPTGGNWQRRRQV